MTEDEEVVSFDVSSLYTNVPVMKAIEICTEHLHSHEQKHPPIDRNTFIILAQIASCDVLMSTHDGYYKQVDGIAMGSPPAPHLANGWMSQFDNTIKGDAVLYARYMDDIIWNIKRIDIEEKLATINNLHPSLKFTIEREENGSIPFLDLKIIHNNGQLSSTWYNKPTDTGLIMLLRQRSTSVRLYRDLCTENTAIAVHGSFFMRAWRKQSEYWNAINTLQTSMTPSLRTP